MTDAGVAHLAGLTALSSLTLTGTQISDDALQYLAGLSNLRTLALWNTAVTDAGMLHLTNLPLESLTVWHTKVGDTGLEHLAQIDTLKTIDVDSSNITDAGLASLADMNSLIKLGLKNGAKHFTPEGLSHLKALTQLTHLEIGPSGISIEGLETIKAIPRLETLIVYDESIDDEWFSHLRIDTLRHLRLHSCRNATVEGIAELLRAMPECKVEAYDADTNQKIEAARKQLNK